MQVAYWKAWHVDDDLIKYGFLEDIWYDFLGMYLSVEC